MATGVANDYVVQPTAPSVPVSEPVDDYDPHTKYPNTIINQESDKQFVRLTMKIPGLKTKRQFNFQKVPENGRLAQAEYKHNKVSLMFILNEKSSDRVCYQFMCKEPFKGSIQEEGSKIKFEDDKIVWKVRKTEKW